MPNEFGRPSTFYLPYAWKIAIILLLKIEAVLDKGAI